MKGFKDLKKRHISHDAAYFDSKDFFKRTISVQITFWKKKMAYEIAINSKCNGYQRRLLSMVNNFMDKETESGVSVNKELAQEWYHSVIKNLKRRRVYAKLKDNIWAANLAEIGSLFSENWGVKYLLCVIDVLIKYSWVKPLTNKKL